MNSIDAFKNVIKEIEINGYTFKVDQLTVFELYSKSQDEYKKAKLKDSLIIADCLSGNEKIQFLKECLNSLPTGEELALELQDFIQSADGVLSLLKFIISKNNPELTEEQVNKIVDPSTIETYQPLYNYALSGIEGPITEEESDPNSQSYEEAKKKE